MSYRDWKVGDKVVVINDVDSSYLIAGEVYTISSIKAFHGYSVLDRSLKDGIGIRVEGIELTQGDHFDVRRFRRFRPVQPRKTDVSVFEALLHTNKQKERV